MNDDWKFGLSMAGIIAAVIALIVGIAVLVESLDNGFTTAEQFEAGNLVCAQHRGIDQFDDIDTEGPGEGPASVICRDGYGTVLLQRTVDP